MIINFKESFNILFPKTCLVCGEIYRHGLVCPICRPMEVGVVNNSSGNLENSENYLGQISSQNYLWDFDQYSKDLIHALKYRGEVGLADYFAERINYWWPKFYRQDQWDFIVPAPQSWGSFFKRGFNQTEIIAEQLPTPILKAVCSPFKFYRQVKKTSEQRRKLSSNRFYLIKPVKGLKLLIFDDVCTTGMTAKIIAEKLYAGGASDVGLLTLARTKVFL